MDSRFIKTYKAQTIGREEFPGLLAHMPKPPATIRVRGSLPPVTHTYITVVGSRRYTDYGKEVCETLVKGLAGLPVVIVSGLAHGIDSIAHRAALSAEILTVAVPGSGLDDDRLYPASHLNLAYEILEKGGALISPFPDDTPAAPWTFPVRNQIMAGLSKVTLVIEAEVKSGTLITSKHAGDFNRDVLAVPGSVLSRQSDGPHMLIRSGATPITCVDDLREALGFERSPNHQKLSLRNDLTKDELRLALIIESQKNMTRTQAHDAFGGEVSDFNATISMLELKGVIRSSATEITIN